ncbi:hypothetical protein QE394_002417 [Arthrobacter sp. SORGH_AS 212]|nr:hypothetical protein [Arthrobacter sp. SORGH_AS_0212]
MQQPSASDVGFREVDQDGSTQGLRSTAEPMPLRQYPRWSVNPFIAMLWLLATALLTGGIWAMATMMFTAGPMGGPPTLSFVMMTFAPQGLLVGTVLVLCLLFWHAWQWQRRRM